MLLSPPNDYSRPRSNRQIKPVSYEQRVDGLGRKYQHPVYDDGERLSALVESWQPANALVLGPSEYLGGAISNIDAPDVIDKTASGQTIEQMLDTMRQLDRKSLSRPDLLRHGQLLLMVSPQDVINHDIKELVDMIGEICRIARKEHQMFIHLCLTPNAGSDPKIAELNESLKKSTHGASGPNFIIEPQANDDMATFIPHTLRQQNFRIAGYTDRYGYGGTPIQRDRQNGMDFHNWHQGDAAPGEPGYKPGIRFDAGKMDSSNGYEPANQTDETGEASESEKRIVFDTVPLVGKIDPLNAKINISKYNPDLPTEVVCIITEPGMDSQSMSEVRKYRAQTAGEKNIVAVRISPDKKDWAAWSNKKFGSGSPDYYRAVNLLWALSKSKQQVTSPAVTLTLIDSGINGTKFLQHSMLKPGLVIDESRDKIVR